jgi:hypothetical protein
MCLFAAFSSSVAFAATDSLLASPFTATSPTRQIDVIAIWNKLTQAQKDAITQQLAPLNNDQRIALLQSYPQFKKLSASELQPLLDQLAQVVPLPVTEALDANFVPVIGFAGWGVDEIRTDPLYVNGQSFTVINTGSLTRVEIFGFKCLDSLNGGIVLSIRQ